MLTFDPHSHIYKMDDRVVPSVTQVIGELVRVTSSGRDYYVNTLTGSLVRAELIEGAGDHGRAVHKACAIILRDGHGGLDWEHIDPSLVHQLQQFEKWLEEWKPYIMYVEEPMYSGKHGFAGTSDIVVSFKSKPAIIDIKTGAYGMAGPQTVAYEMLYKTRDQYRGTVKRYVLHLPKTGPYKFVPLTDKRDWDFFRSRLYQWQYLNS